MRSLAPVLAVLPAFTAKREMLAIEATWSTILFVDLRGYTGLAERLPAAELIPLLETFFRLLIGATEKHGGRVYHMAGDGLMAGFGTNTSQRSAARAALACARSMLRRFAPIATLWHQALHVETGIGVGIHSGEIAYLKVHRRAALELSTLIGDTVNVAARLCARARAGEVLFSSSVATAMEDAAFIGPASPGPYLRLPQLELRGRIAPLDIWCLPATVRLNLRNTAQTADELQH